jgi:ribosomal protein L22
MEALAKSRHVRSSAPKLRIVAKHVKGVTANQALVTLHSLARRNKGAYLIEKTLKSALAARMSDLAEPEAMTSETPSRTSGEA